MSEPSPDAQDSTDRRAKRRPSPDDEATARRLFGLILSGNAGAKKPNFDQWADEVRLMREVDNRSHADMLSLFTWVRADSFWRPNVLSPAKLRDKWDQLTEKRNQGSTARQPAINEKYNFGHLDRSGDQRAMEESMRRNGVTVPEGDEEIEI